MKYMMLIYAAAQPEDASLCTPPVFEDWMAYDKEVQEAGIFVAGHSLADLTTATTVRVGEAGDRTVTDGPFAETREVIGGYYVIDVADLDAALDWAARCPGSRAGGTIEVRPVADFEG